MSSNTTTSRRPRAAAFINRDATTTTQQQLTAEHATTDTTAQDAAYEGDIHVNTGPAETEEETHEDSEEQPQHADNTTQASSPDVATSDASKKTTPEWVVASRPIKFGPRRVLWTFYKVLRLYNRRWIPVPRAVGFYWKRTYENRRWVYAHRLVIGAIVLLFSKKGGVGKTTIATWLAAEERTVTEHDVLVFDADSGGGHAAGRFGLDPDATLGSADAVQRITKQRWVPTPRDLYRLIAQHEGTGVLVTYMRKQVNVTRLAMARTLQTLWPAVSSIYVDCTPGFKEDNTYGAASVATVAVLPGCIHVHDDMSSIRTTLDEADLSLRTRDYGGRSCVVIAIEAVTWREYNLRTVYEMAKKFDVDPSAIVLIPYDPWLKGTKPVIFDRDAREFLVLKPKTRYALSELLRRRGEVAMAYNLANSTITQAAVPATDTPSETANL